MTRLGVLPWIAPVFAIHLFVLSRFWFNAPLLDDYDCILDSLGALARAGTVQEWLSHLFALMNEHRLAGTRLISQVLAWTTGGVDFRVLMLLGTLFVFGIFAFVWAEFRDESTGAITAAAALLLLQWSYWEALLMASASTAHLGTAFFSVGALYYALRPGRGSAAACAVGGIVAAYSQANGLFVLPLAGVACMVLGNKRRGIVLLVLAAIVWTHYFIGFSQPANHPSMLRALDDPVLTFQLFLIIIGGIVPSLAQSQLVGAVILAGLGWIAWRGLWRRHPTVFLWIAFVLVTAATVAVARVGFGLFWGSRYAINAALLLAILMFAIFSLTRPWRPGAEMVAVGAAGVLWIAVVIEALPHMRERSFRGHLLVEVQPSGQQFGPAHFAGMQHPHQAHAARILQVAQAHRWYSPSRQAVSAPVVAITDKRPLAGLPVGVMNEVTPKDSRVLLRGWTDVPATAQGRKFTIYTSARPRAVNIEAPQAREDVAMALRRPDALLSGFSIVVGFDSEEEAREAARSICIFVEAPGRPITEILRPGFNCR